jgi:hypothetical protein
MRLYQQRARRNPAVTRRPCATLLGVEQRDSMDLDMRPETLLPLTLEEHRELGQELRIAGARLRELERLITSVYGPNSRASFGFSKLSEAVERLQQEMEAQAQADLPGFITERLYL